MRHPQALWAFVVAVQACNQLLGVEQAYVDPALNDTNTLTSSSSAGGSDGNTSGGSGGIGTSTSGGSGGGLQSDDDDGGPGAAGDKGANPMSTQASSTSGGNMGMATSAGGTQGGPATLCDTYCDDIMEYCTEEDMQYRDRAQCMVVCNMIPEGELGVVGENTVSCRAKYAAGARYLSGTEQGLHCRRAGPGGAGYCGSNCDGFCSLMMGVCTGKDVGIYQFENEEACLAECETLPEAPIGYSASDPAIADGNHVGCRLFHVTSAAMLDTEEHCEHSMGVTLCEVPEAE